MTMNQNGFTTKEFVMTLAVLGLLCGLAVPPYFMMQEARENVQAEKIVQSLETKLRIHKNETGAFPAKLDDNQALSVCQSCFAKIINNTLQQNRWYKLSDTLYLFSPKPVAQTDLDANASGFFRLQYQSHDGQLLLTRNP